MEKVDLGIFEEEKPCPYEQDEDTLTKLQRSVTLFLAKRAMNNPTEDDSEFADILQYRRSGYAIYIGTEKSIK